jgi:hypothetical protein
LKLTRPILLNLKQEKVARSVTAAFSFWQCSKSVKETLSHFQGARSTRYHACSGWRRYGARGVRATSDADIGSQQRSPPET